MTTVLRPVLYQQLVRVFGKVKVTNHGIAVKWSLRTEQWRNGGSRPVRFLDKSKNDTWGETYHVNCPYCNDQRQRLYIGHMWGHVDPVTSMKNLWLVYCQNENCVDTPQMRQSLFELIWTNGDLRRSSDVVMAGKEPKKLGEGEVDYPGSVWPLDRLPPDHRALCYLRDRRYDSIWLAKTLGIGYIWEPPPGRECLRDRIFIPVYIGGVLIGWQSRSVYDPRAGEVKYLFSRQFPRSMCLYNYDLARPYREVTVLEGATKVWRFGCDSVGAFGKAVTARQLELLTATWQDIVFMLDANARKESLELPDRVGSSAEFRVVLLQDGQAPDDMRTDEVRRLATCARLYPPGSVLSSEVLEGIP